MSLPLTRVIVVGGRLDTRSCDCDGAGMWIGQTLGDDGQYHDATDYCNTRQEAQDQLGDL